MEERLGEHEDEVPPKPPVKKPEPVRQPDPDRQPDDAPGIGDVVDFVSDEPGLGQEEAAEEAVVSRSPSRGPTPDPPVLVLTRPVAVSFPGFSRGDYYPPPDPEPIPPQLVPPAEAKKGGVLFPLLVALFLLTWANLD